MITIEVDLAEAERVLGDLVQRQLPYATSVALNALANDAQRAIQGSLSDRFTLRRRPFIERTIKIAREDRATKADLRATVRVDPARDLLAKFELGGIKRPRGAHVAVPIEARSVRTDLVPKTLRPRALQLRPASDRSGSQRIVGARRTFLAADTILQRVGRGRSSRVKVLFALETSVPIAPRLRFAETAAPEVERLWPRRFDEALERALWSARR